MYVYIYIYIYIYYINLGDAPPDATARLREPDEAVMAEGDR